MATVTAMGIDFKCSDEWLAEEVCEAAESIFSDLGIDTDANADLFDDFRYERLEVDVLAAIDEALDSIDWRKVLDPDRYRDTLLPYVTTQED